MSFDSILDFLVSIALELAPEFFKDPLHRQFLVLAVFIFGFTFAMMIFLYSFKWIKSPKTRIKSFVVSGCVIANIVMLFAFVNRTEAPLRFGEILALFVLNLLFYFMYRIANSLKSVDIQSNLNLNSDLKLKEVKNGRLGLRVCPGCGAKTISQAHALRVAQTCGECGRRYRASGWKHTPTLVGFIFLIVLFTLLYLVEAQTLNREQAKWSVIVSLLAMFVILLRPRKLIEVK